MIKLHVPSFFLQSLIDEANFGFLQRQAKPIYDMIRRNDSLKAAEAYGGFFDSKDTVHQLSFLIIDLIVYREI